MRRMVSGIQDCGVPAVDYAGGMPMSLDGLWQGGAIRRMSLVRAMWTLVGMRPYQG